ncbi:undecaprenyl-phosphate glucose phosphotransferase [Prosthecomicrobium pneumaticum]|uniref:Undecaprenyl-phosphate glucose phosphotransferase n=1 Tax=Prosthecomicrobium pneumaticum TaxID=81895 RepID=A0A7W9L3Q4_9HYPH|nr:undecaprenyl-phosphate glucose phosphotransferase [Prosthecomicrobium pneumaticum]MBB5754779.1 Undecaprenyl-phosphate glucose phosphotransferase [Prosthecomicrobium pneumaticum]
MSEGVPAGDGTAADALNAHARAVAAALSRKPMAPGSVAFGVGLAEALALSLCGALLSLARIESTADAGFTYGLPILGGTLFAIAAIRAADGYAMPALRHPVRGLAPAFGAWTLVFAVFAVLAFFLQIGDVYSRIWFAAWYGCGLAALVLVRLAAARLIRVWTRSGRLERRVVIVGGGQRAADLIAALSVSPEEGLRICGIFDDRGGERSPDIVAGHPKLGTIAELVAFARIARIDLLIVSLPLAAEARVLALLKELWVLPVDIRLSALGNRLRFRPRSYSYLGAVPLLDLFDRPIAGFGWVAKRAFDLVIGGLALVLLSPVMLATALAVRLDSPGPVLFRQKRYGFNNEVIEVLKFRSMYHHLSDPGAKVAVRREDDRVTRVGRFIRRTSLDELPQLVNVLRGELSLVGPRPHAVTAHTENRLWNEVVDGYFARHRVKPGITGWAQVNGWRGEVDTPEKLRRRIEDDLYYIEHWSVLFDLYILVLTPFRLFGAENAY